MITVVDRERLDVTVGCLDMPTELFEEILDVVIKCRNENSVLWAREVKRELDTSHHPIWNVIVGDNFSVYTTYQMGLFAHFWLQGTELVVYKIFGIDN